MALCGVRQSAVEVVFAFLDEREGGPHRLSRAVCGRDGGVEMTGQVARLQFSDPVVAGNDGEPRVGAQPLLAVALSGLRIVEVAELRSRATERAHQCEMRGELLHDEREARLLRVLDPLL